MTEEKRMTWCIARRPVVWISNNILELKLDIVYKTTLLVGLYSKLIVEENFKCFLYLYKHSISYLS